MANVTALIADLSGNLDQFFLVIMGCLIFCEYILSDSTVSLFPFFFFFFVFADTLCTVRKVCESFRNLNLCMQLNLIPPSREGKKLTAYSLSDDLRTHQNILLKNEKNVCNEILT